MFVLKERQVGLNCLAFSPDGATLAASRYRGPLQVWDLADQRLTRLISIGRWNTRMVFFLPQGEGLVVLTGGSLRVFDPNGKALGTRPEGDQRQSAFAAAAPPHRRVCLGTGYGYPALEQYTLPEFEPVWKHRALTPGAVTALGYSGDGKWLAAGCNTGQVRIHDADSGAVLSELAGNHSEVKAVALSPDGQFVAWAAAVHLFLWRLNPLRPIKHHTLGRTHFHSVSFHPSGEFFATANGDGKIDYWDARTGEHRQAFDWKVGKLHDVIFDATGDRAACSSRTGEVVVWDVDR